MGLVLKGLRTVIHPVDDLAAAKAWWTALLGVEPYFHQPFYVGFEVAGYELGLLPDGADPAAGALTYWGVDDCQTAVDAALALGATVHTEPTEVGEGIVTGTVVSPQGSIVGFIVNPHFRPTPPPPPRSASGDPLEPEGALEAASDPSGSVDH